MKKYVLDACALMAALYGEDGANVVKAAFDEVDKGLAKIIMHKANLLEVYYDMVRLLGINKADEILGEIKKRPFEINFEITDDIFTEAGRLKAHYKISFADSFALAQAKVFDGVLLTADPHEFDIIKGKEDIKFAWIR